MQSVETSKWLTQCSRTQTLEFFGTLRIAAAYAAYSTNFSKSFKELFSNSPPEKRAESKSN